MIRIDLTTEEADDLGQVLSEYLSDLRMEVAGTDQKDFRERLKRREAFLKRLLHTLGVPVG